MHNRFFPRPLLAAAATLFGILTLTPPAVSWHQAMDDVVSSDIVCRLFLDPHDKFTRVVADPGERASRASAVLSQISVNYTGFTADAQNAFQAAIDIWQTQVSTLVPIVVDAHFTDLGNPLLLGDARFRSLSFNFPGAPLGGVLFPGPIANRLSGVDRDGAQSEMIVRLNSGANWNFATDGVPVSGKADFVSAALHELGHGLGFGGSATVTAATGAGSWGYQVYPYIYDVGIADSAGVFLLNQSVYPNNSIALGSLLQGTGASGPGLFWAGLMGTAGNHGIRPRIHAPATFVIGSSYHHLDRATFPSGDLNSLMAPSLGLAEVIQTPGGVVNGMFADMGWGLRCSFGLSRRFASVPGAGGTVSATLSTSSGCPWTATTGSSFATINTPSGSGSAIISVTVSPNAGANARVAVVQIGDQTFTIAQTGTIPCTYSLAPPSRSIGGAGGTGTVDLTTLDGCPWTAIAAPSEAVITSAPNGVGSATISYRVATNPTCSQRAVTITIAGLPFVITQAPSPPNMTLDTASLRFGALTTGTAFAASTSAQRVRLSQNGAGTVTWTAATSSPWLVVSPASGTGPAVLDVSVQHASGLTASQAGTVTVTYSDAVTPTSTLNVTLGVTASSTAPIGSFDTPLNDATGVAGSIPVTGWAVDDVEVRRVRIMRDPVAGEPAGALVFIGDADLVEGARPDVQALYPGLPRSSRAGWGYLMLTNFLPNLGNGVFRLTAIAEDAEGRTTVLGTKTITCANASATTPFGAIDTPAQGGTASGTLDNFGWVLSRWPNRADPPGGGTVQIAIDGSFISAVPAGWTSRDDLSALFAASAYPGIGSALGVASINTTALANGVHTIAWVVTDSGGAASGVGSRYFSVANEPGSTGTCFTPPAVTGTREGVSALRMSSAAPFSWRRGYDRNAAYRAAERGADGRVTLHAEEIDRIEIPLGRGATGHLRVGGDLRGLPIGAAIDPITGTFTWQPGVGFVGAYDFVLAGRDVRIVLDAKGSGRVGTQIAIDLPSRDGRDVSGPFVVAGWAADLDAARDGGVDTVHVWAYPIVEGKVESPVFLGAAAYGGARPDVAAIYGDRFGQSGYGLEVSSLTPGTYDIAVFAYSTVTGGFAPAKTVRVTVR